jgi:hypothetical protein
MGFKGLAAALTLTVCAVLVFGPGSVAAKPPANEPCTNEPTFGWQGDWETKQVQIPSLTNPDGISSYAAIVRRPRDLIVYPNQRPVIFLQPGTGGGQCSLSWLARDLAGHGYVTVTWTTPKAKQGGSDFANASDSVRSAVSWARGPSNPYLPISDTTKTALAGFGLGGDVVSLLQSEAALGTDAAIALDNLVRFAVGDPGAGTSECKDAAHSFEVTPAVPALGFARDATCTGGTQTPLQKLPGFVHWRGAKVPSMELTMAGFAHGDFGSGGSKGQYRSLSYYSESWLERWLFERTSANGELLAKQVNGRPTQELLSTAFLSGAYLPGVVNTLNYRDYIQRDHSIPDTTKTGGPDNGKKVSAKQLRRTGITFRFRADEPATFECRLDNADWNACEPPKKVERNLEKGKHTFRVRATDAADNQETKPAKWDFRVVG